MSDAADSDGVLRTAGEGVGSFIAGIPSAISEFFGGVGEGAGVNGTFDWIALILGLALLASAVRGLRRGGIVGPVFSGFIALAFMGWAIT